MATLWGFLTCTERVNRCVEWVRMLNCWFQSWWNLDLKLSFVSPPVVDKHGGRGLHWNACIQTDNVAARLICSIWFLIKVSELLGVASVLPSGGTVVFTWNINTVRCCEDLRARQTNWKHGSRKKNTEQDTHGRIQISAVNWRLSEEHLFRGFFFLSLYTKEEPHKCMGGWGISAP